MENNHLKDFVISIVVICFILFGIKDYYLFNHAEKIPYNSTYRDLALNKGLLDKINNIEQSIQDRKSFKFNVKKDPLEQNLIVKTQKDMEAEWRKKVENMLRLEYTIIPATGNKIASIVYKGKTQNYEIGDKFAFGTIVNITAGEIVYKQKDFVGTLKTEKIPPKPEMLKKNKNKRDRSLNW